jgi:uncharacterized protein (TIGR02001 family)
MKNLTKSVITAAVLAATSSVAMAEVSMNVGVTSNYMWRGITQADDGAAVSGGADYAHESGVYAGVWASSLGLIGAYGSEVDYYAGWAGEFSGVGVDAGYISYTYPESDSDEINADLGFSEIYLGASYGMFSAKYSVDNDNDNKYIEVGANIALPEEYTLGLHAGSYDMDVADDYTDYSLSLSKGDITLSYSNMSENVAYNVTDNARIAISWGTSF